MERTDWKAERRKQKTPGTTIPTNPSNRWYKRHPISPFVTAYASPGVNSAFDGALAPYIPPSGGSYSQSYVSPLMNEAAKNAKKRQGMR